MQVFAKELTGRPYSPLLTFDIVSMYDNVFHSSAEKAVEFLCEWLRKEANEPPTACLSLARWGEKFKLKWSLPGKKAFSVSSLCEAVWVAMRVDGWQDWGEETLLPNHSICMGAEWAPALASIFCSAAEVQALESLPMDQRVVVSSSTYRYLDNTVSTSQRWFDTVNYPFMENKREMSNLLAPQCVQFLDCAVSNSKGFFALRLNKDPAAKKAFYSLIARGGRKASLWIHLTRIQRLTCHIWVQGEEALVLSMHKVTQRGT